MGSFESLDAPQFRAYVSLPQGGSHMARFAINGFGRIGRNTLRAAIKRGANLDVVLINDVDTPKTLAHLFKYDSVHGIFPGTVESTENAVVINGKKIAVSAKRDPSELA